jgi:hypothetical protein
VGNRSSSKFFIDEMGLVVAVYILSDGCDCKIARLQDL